MTSHDQFFIEQSVALARSMPLPDSVRYLHGLCTSCPDVPYIEDIRKALIALSESDKQLELIQTGQLKLKL